MPTDLKDKIIAVDFDSTISHCPVWKGAGIFGEPVLNAKWALERFKEMGATIIINSTRREIAKIKEYLDEYKIPYDFVNWSPRNLKQSLSSTKVAADIYIDDRNVSFRGEWKDTYLETVNFKNWERK